MFINKRLSQQIRVSASITEKGLYRYVVLRENKTLTRSDGKQWTDHLKSDFKGGGGGGGGEKQNKTAREPPPPPTKKSQVKPTWGGGWDAQTELKKRRKI